MKTTRIMAIAVLIVGSAVALHAAQSQQPGVQSQQPGVKRTDLQRDEAAAAALIAPTAGSTHGAPLGETVTVAADEPIPNLPGEAPGQPDRRLPPGASSAAHRHARSANHPLAQAKYSFCPKIETLVRR